MVKFRNVRIKKRGGGFRLQRAKVLTSGKLKFVKNIRKKSPASRTRSVKTRRRGVRRMPRRKKRRGGKSITQQAFKWIRIGALAAPAVARLMSPIAPKEKIERLIQDYTGYNMHDGRFEWEWLARGWMPYVAANLVTHGVPKLANILRRL